MSFHGSYGPDDVEFLLKPIEVEPMEDLEEKERLIQSGVRHYSEMLSPERAPSERYLGLFRRAYAANRARMARDCLRLAALIAAARGPEITIVSLARAGTPVGVIVSRLLRRVFGRTATHYSVSIIRDRGIDRVALDTVLARGHGAESIAFVDGWTGKGVIARELAQAVEGFNRHHSTAIDPGLHVLADLAGEAAVAASGEDYLIPSSILNATVSGLVSRSVLNEHVGPRDFHGCVYYRELECHDLSCWFAHGVGVAALDLARAEGVPTPQPVDRTALAAVSGRFIEATAARRGVADLNLIKPGIGEATRVLLRRVPRLLILREPGSAEVEHLEVLAREKAVPVAIDRSLPYQAVALIRSTIDA